MNNVVGVASQIRTNTGAKLLREISLKTMKRKLIDLFKDRTSDKPVNLFNDDKIRKVMQYKRCKSLNDKRKIEFHQSCIQDSDVFDESKQIWIPNSVNPINDDLFIPRNDYSGGAE